MVNLIGVAINRELCWCILLLFQIVVDGSLDLLPGNQVDEVLSFGIADILAIEFSHGLGEQDNLVAILRDIGDWVIFELQDPQAVHGLQHRAHLLLKVINLVILEVQRIKSL